MRIWLSFSYSVWQPGFGWWHTPCIGASKLLDKHVMPVGCFSMEAEALLPAVQHDNERKLSEHATAKGTDLCVVHEPGAEALDLLVGRDSAERNLPKALHKTTRGVVSTSNC